MYCEKLELLKNSVKTFLRSLTNTINVLHVNEHWHGFYIGKTENMDCENFRLSHERRGMPFYWQLSSEGNPDVIGQLEYDLIEYFRNSQEFRHLCCNEGAGNEGNDRANMLYIAIRYNVREINELDFPEVVVPKVINVSNIRLNN